MYNSSTSNFKRNPIRAFVLKSVIFILLALSLALAIESMLDSEFTHLTRLDRALSDGNHVILIGDSTLLFTAPSDTSTMQIGDFIALNTGYNATSISEGGYHLGVYEHYVEYICRTSSHPSLIVIPINMQSFSPDEYLNPHRQFREHIVRIDQGRSPTLLERLWERVYRIFGKNPETLAKQEAAWNEQAVYYNSTQIGTVGDFNYHIIGSEPTIDTLQRNKFIYLYLGELTGEHPHIKSLQAIIADAQQCDLDLLLYITPIDYEEGIRLVGENFTSIVNQNKAVVTAVANAHDVAVIDLSYNLSSEHFPYHYSPDEHVDEDGRRFIGETLSTWIRAHKPLR